MAEPMILILLAMATMGAWSLFTSNRHWLSLRAHVHRK
jgi:hypothetical protein